MSSGKIAMRKSTVQGTILAVISVCLTTLGLELALRIYHGEVLRLRSFSTEPHDQVGRMAYHPRLGWIPRPGRFASNWTANVDASGVRSNGRSIWATSRPILAVGDSFTFGDEVEDNETWAAHLEEVLNKRVLNAGVSAYGIDQAVLRAELLLDEYHPDVVILSFISDDIHRTEFSYYPYGRGWKPYFEFANGSLSLRNVPVPQKPDPRRFQTLRRVLGYSFVANAVFRRTAHGWWPNLSGIERVHTDGEKVSVDLLARLDALTKNRGGQFIAIALATKGRVDGNSRLPNVIKRAREKGIQVLDLSMETLNLQPDRPSNMFRAGGHYSPPMNSWIADHIAAFLHERGIAKRATEHPVGHHIPHSIRPQQRDITDAKVHCCHRRWYSVSMPTWRPEGYF
jgi:hypothetical protein